MEVARLVSAIFGVVNSEAGSGAALAADFLASGVFFAVAALRVLMLRMINLETKKPRLFLGNWRLISEESPRGRNEPETRSFKAGKRSRVD